MSVVDLVDRLHGYARAQAGDPDGGWTLVEASIAASRQRDAAYDVALGLEALARIGAFQGRPDVATFEAEAAGLFAGLGVVRTPAVPLPAPPA